MKHFAHPQNDKSTVGQYVLVLVLVMFSMLFFGALPITLASYFRGASLVDKQVSLTDVFSKNELFFYNMVPFGLFLIALWIGVKFILKRPLLSIITLRKSFDFKRYFFGLFLWLVLLSVVLVIAFGDESAAIVWNYDSSKFWFVFMLSIVLTPLQTGFEEFVFRGLLIQLFGKVFRQGAVIALLGSLLFMAIHLGNPEVREVGWIAVIFYFFSGLFTSIIVLMDDGLELPWGFHTANNFFGILILTNEWQVIQTDALFLDKSAPSMGWDMLVTLVVFYPLMLFIFAKVYKWSAWKEKLFQAPKEKKEVN